MCICLFSQTPHSLIQPLCGCLAQQIFAFQMPATIKEECERYGSTNAYEPSTASTSANTTRPSSRGTPVIRNREDIRTELENLERTIPLPGMPIKNARIIPDGIRMPLPKEAQVLAFVSDVTLKISGHFVINLDFICELLLYFVSIILTLPCATNAYDVATGTKIFKLT